MLLFSPTGLDGKFSYAFKLSLEKGVSRKEFTKSYVEEARGAGRPRGGALVGGGLSRGGVRASTLDSSSKARAGMGLFSKNCQGSRPSLLLRQRLFTSLQLLHPSPWGY